MFRETGKEKMSNKIYKFQQQLFAEELSLVELFEDRIKRIKLMHIMKWDMVMI